MRNSFVDRLMRLAEHDRRIVLITGDLGYNCFEPFAAKFPRQFLNAGVAEQNMTGLATGLALEGHVVFTYSIANFTFMRCLEQIRNDAAYHDCNVNVVSVGGGFSYGALGISHHATEDLTIMRSIPNTTVVAPGDDWEAAEATEAIANTPGVSYLRLDRSTAGCTQRPAEEFVLGKARLLRQGTDVTFAVTGGLLEQVLKAADLLEQQHGISSRVLSMHTVKPLDVEALSAAARETGGLITVEEHRVDGGLGGAAAEALLERGEIPRFFHRIGLRAGFSSTVGNQQYLRSVYGMDVAAICAAALERLSPRLAIRRAG
ncbi:transketolase family protein [Planctomicrobium sp. SH664]|uniref:transketolase family protein n=1 Tax=Planctomicrobium sp. SH664 TaxID=3448125 RepID=UPI003F5C5FB3